VGPSQVVDALLVGMAAFIDRGIKKRQLAAEINFFDLSAT
jgi:hypothetical protein